MYNFLIILVFWATKPIQVSDRKITIFPNLWYKSGYVLKNGVTDIYQTIDNVQYISGMSVFMTLSIFYIQDTSQVLDKCTRLTFEIICKCMMGEFDNDAQSSTNHDAVYRATGVLSTMIIWRIQHFLQMRILQIIPFGEAIFGPFSKSLSKGLLCYSAYTKSLR